MWLFRCALLPGVCHRAATTASDENQRSPRDGQAAGCARRRRSRHESAAGPRATCQAQRRSGAKQQYGVSAAGRSERECSASYRAL